MDNSVSLLLSTEVCMICQYLAAKRPQCPKDQAYHSACVRAGHVAPSTSLWAFSTLGKCFLLSQVSKADELKVDC